MHPTRAVLLLIAATTALRLVPAATTGLGVDESYMVGNARVWALSTVDHPPLHVWIVAAVRTLTGSESAFVLRLPFLLLAAGSAWNLFRLTAALFDARAGLWAVVLFGLAPVFTISTAGWILPDGPLVFFLLVAARSLLPLVDGRDLPTGRWLATGLLVGLAALSKVHAAFFVLGTFGLLATTAPGRRTLASPGPWLAAGVALLVFSPVVVWNLRNGGLGLQFQLGRLDGRFRPLDVLGNLAGQAAYLLPWLAVPLAWRLAVALRRGPDTPRTWFLALLAIGPIGFFGLMAGFARAFPHWPMPGWLFALPLLGAWLAEQRSAWPSRIAVGTAALVVGAVGLLSTHAVTGWLVPVVGSDPLREMRDWDALPVALRERGLLDRDTVVAAMHWTEAGKIRYALGPDVPVVCLCDGPQRASFAEATGDAILVIGTSRRLAGIEKRFDRVEGLAPIVIERGGHPILTLEVRRGGR